MDYTTWNVLQGPKEEGPENLLLARSLYHCVQALPDGRRKQGKRYSQALLICLLMLAKLAGETTLSGATEWIRHRAEPIARAFGLCKQRMPCQMTYCRMLARLDGPTLDELLAAFFTGWETRQRCAEEPSRLQTPDHHLEHAQLAVDGKTICSTSKQEHPVHLLSCSDVKTGTVLWQCNVQEKHNEISTLKPLITPTLVKGRIVTLDAMHTQRDLCLQIHRFGGGYILIAKENQPTLLEDITDLFEDRDPDRGRWMHAHTWDKGHGRMEYRHLTCSPDLNDWFGPTWSGIEQVFRLERTTWLLKTGEVRHHVVYGLSNLPMHQASPERMLELIRAHWAIENRLHWRRDVTLGEDACQSTTGNVPAVLARLNSTVLNLMDRLGVRNVARQTRFFAANLEQAVHLLLTGSCSVY